MCERNEDLQKAWKPKIGDWCADPDHDEGVLASIGSLTLTKKYDKWLPTQEQLQEMLKLDPVTLIYLIDKFVANGEGYWHSFAKALYPNPSMNELWLAFVMKEKYNKKWTGSKWVANE